MENDADDVNALRDQAKAAILRAIVSEESLVGYSRSIGELAEAYAWITSPHQSHGGSTKVQVSK